LTSSGPQSVRQRLAARGVLRAAINISNTLLVSGRDASGHPTGLAPSVARALAAQLDVSVELIPFSTPAEITDKRGLDVWDIALIGSEHARTGEFVFTPAYALIEATYLVHGSAFNTVEQVDAKGIRVAAPARTAYGLWLERNLVSGTLVLADGIAAARDLFARGEVDALAGLRPWLLADSHSIAGAAVLRGRFTAIAQAIGYVAIDSEVAGYLGAFVEDAKRSGLISRLMTELGASGVTVAPPVSD
jgi:polar amino acid transport system substrate-binding protein